MADSQTLQLLCCELSFLKIGGYGNTLHNAWRPTLISRDSPLCANFDSSAPHQPCERCWLYEFVPDDKRNAFMPCHYIPLNKEGHTITELYRQGTQERLDQAVQNWLEATMTKLQRGEQP